MSRDQHFLLLRLNIVTLLAFFETYFPRSFERVFFHGRAKVGELDSSACTRRTELCGRIRYLGSLVAASCKTLQNILNQQTFSVLCCIKRYLVSIGYPPLPLNLLSPLIPLCPPVLALELALAPYV